MDCTGIGTLIFKFEIFTFTLLQNQLLNPSFFLHTIINGEIFLVKGPEYPYFYSNALIRVCIASLVWVLHY